MKFRFVVLFVLFTLALNACSLASDITPPPDYKSPTPAPTMGPLFPVNPPDVVAGAAIFTEKCAPCHGEKGLGDGPMAAQLQKAPAALGKPEVARAAAPVNWYTTVTQGNINSFMPPFSASLNDQQRWDVVAYAISLGTSPDEVAQGKVIYEANCVQCHGTDGKLVAKSDFTDQALMSKLAENDIVNFVGKGIDPMPGFAGKLGDAEMVAVAAYVRSFTLATGQTASVSTSTPEPSTVTSTTVASADAGTPASTNLTATPAEMVGTISGKVNNASGGAVPADLKAILHTFEHDTTIQQFSEISTLEAPVGADGTYVFAKVSMSQNHAFFVSVDYGGTTYESDPAVPQQDGKTDYILPITIYETSTDTANLVAEQVHILLDYSKPEVVQVVEFIVITNPGDKTIISAEKGGPVVKVSLPQGYSNLQFEQGALGDRYIKTDDGFADTLPVPPSPKPGQQNQPSSPQQYSLVFAFDLAAPKPGLFGGTTLELSQPFSIKANAVSFLVPVGVTAAGTNFSDGGIKDMGNGATFQLYTVGLVDAGQTFKASVSGKPSTASTIPIAGMNSTQNIIIGVGAFGLVLILVGVWLFWRDRQRPAEVDEEESDEDDEDGVDAEELMDAIVAIDDQYKAGNISEEAYKERRAELKAKLKSGLK